MAGDNWPPNSDLILNNSLLELIYFLNKHGMVWKIVKSNMVKLNLYLYSYV